VKDDKILIERPNPDENIRYSIKFKMGSFFKVEDTEYTPTPLNLKSIFGKYITQLFPDSAVRDVVYEFSAAPFFEGISFQKALWMFGEGSNGKSSLIQLLKLITPSFRSTDFNSLAGRFGPSSLMDAAVIGISEVDANCKIPEALIKSIISGDNIPVDRKNRSILNNTFTGKLFCASNGIPTIYDKSDGWYRRWTYIHLPTVIEEKDRIGNIERKIFDDSESMLDLMNMLFLAALRMKKRGNIIPDSEMPISIKDAKAKLRGENNVIGQWLDNSCFEVDDKSALPRFEIYNDFHEECVRDGQTFIPSAKHFWPELERTLKRTGKSLKTDIKMTINGRTERCCNMKKVILKLTPEFVPGFEDDMDIPMLSMDEVIKTHSIETAIH